MNCWCPNLCCLSSFMCRDLENVGGAEGIRRATTWKSNTNIGQPLHGLRSFLSFSLSSYICSLFSQYSFKATSWSLTQVLKVQASLTFCDAVKAISPFTRTSVDTVLGWCSSWNLSRPAAVRGPDHLSRFCTGHGKMRERPWSTRLSNLHPSKSVNLSPLITTDFT